MLRRPLRSLRAPGASRVAAGNNPAARVVGPAEVQIALPAPTVRGDAAPVT